VERVRLARRIYLSFSLTRGFPYKQKVEAYIDLKKGLNWAINRTNNNKYIYKRVLNIFIKYY